MSEHTGDDLQPVTEPHSAPEGHVDITMASQEGQEDQGSPPPRRGRGRPRGSGQPRRPAGTTSQEGRTAPDQPDGYARLAYIPSLTSRKTITALRTAAAVKGVLEGKTISEIGREIGISPASVSNYLDRPIAQRLLLAELEAAGVGPRRMAQKLSQLLDAKRIQLLPDGNGGVEERLVDDNRTQLRATEISIKLYERLTGASEETSDRNRIASEVELSREHLKNATIEELQIIAVRRRENRTEG